MKSTFIMIAAMISLSACNSGTVQFDKLSEEELLAYNRSMSLLDRVHCVEEVRIGSHLPQRFCVTYRDVVEGHLGTLDIPSSSSSRTYAQ